MGGAPPTPPGLCTAGGPGGAIFGGSPQGPPRRREGPPRINAPGVGGGGYLPTNPPAGSDLWARRPPGEGRRPTSDPPTPPYGGRSKPAPARSGPLRLCSAQKPAGRSCRSLAVIFAEVEPRGVGWSRPPRWPYPPTPPWAESELVTGPGPGVRGAAGGTPRGVGPAPLRAQPGPQAPVQGATRGVWGVPPHSEGPLTDTPGGSGGVPPGPGSMGVNLGAGGDTPPRPPRGPPGPPPHPGGSGGGSRGGTGGPPGTPPGPRGAKKCTFFWVFNNSPSRDKDGTLFWDKFRLRWDSSRLTERLWDPL